jgi:hypothetical protein
MDNISVEVGEVDDRKVGGTISHFIRDHLGPVHRRGEQWCMIVTILDPIDGRWRGTGAE